MVKIFLVCLILFTKVNLSLAGNLLLEPWASYSDPIRMSKNFQKKFSSLPTVGQAIGREKFWSSDYWPHNKGSINYRWNALEPIGFNLKSPSKEEALRMSPEELRELAPSEKLDLLNGHYTYPFKNLVGKRVSPHRKEWEGICHGWAAANLNHKEPLPKILNNPDGIAIPFGSSDIKALISYYYAYYYRPVSTHQMGRRCYGKEFCDQDMNAGAFHIVLANKLGLEGNSFIADLDRGREVWNHVVYSYRSEVLENNLPPAHDSAKGTVKVIRLNTVMVVVFNIAKNSWEPVRGSSLQTYRTENYKYDLDIDKYGKIVGGKWISKNRPDFLWLVAGAKNFSGRFLKMPELLND